MMRIEGGGERKNGWLVLVFCFLVESQICGAGGGGSAGIGETKLFLYYKLSGGAIGKPATLVLIDKHRV